jgi:adenylate kinase
MALVLILLGAPGAGKGTQAKHLCAELVLAHVSTGDILRENRAQGTPLGREAEGFMSRGALVPDQLVLDMLFERVARPDCARGFLLDGFPRTLAQARALEQRLGQRATLRALNLEVPEPELVARLTGRLTCRSCGAMYHQRLAPPESAGRCDACGGELYQRDDDQASVVDKRLSVYREQTQPLLAFYSERGVLTSVDGNRPPREVTAALLRAAQGEAA